MSISSAFTGFQHVKVECLKEDGNTASKEITLAPGETLLADACASAGTPEINLGNDLFAGTDHARHGPRGIRLTSDARPGSFAAFAIAPHLKNGDRYLSSILFADPKLVHSANTVFAGVPVGPTSLLPEGRYTPEISVVNFSTSEIHINATFALTSRGAPNTQEVGHLTVPPGSSREIVFDGLMGDPDLQNSLIVHSDGPPGALTTKLVSQGDESQLHEVELQAKDERDANNAGEHPWSIEQNTESTLLLFNHSETLQPFDLTVVGGGVTWQKTYKLAPMETKAISMRELVEDRAKDDNSHELPASAQFGELNWMVVDPHKGSGRLMQSDKAKHMARNFSCGYSGLLCGATSQTFETTLGVGVTGNYAQTTAVTCTSGQQNDCSGQQTGTGGSFTYFWTSGSTNIATIANNTDTSALVSVHGVSAGTSLITGNIHSQYCYTAVSGTQTIQNPTKMVVYYDPENVQNNACAVASQNGAVRNIQYQLQNGSGNVGSSYIQETFENVPTNTCGNGSPTASTCKSSYTTATGVFTDILATNYCSTKANNACGVSITPDIGNRAEAV